MSTQGKNVVVVEVSVILALGTGLVSCLSFPECHIFILHPEKNTKEQMLGKHPLGRGQKQTVGSAVFPRMPSWAGHQDNMLYDTGLPASLSLSSFYHQRAMRHVCRNVVLNGSICLIHPAAAQQPASVWRGEKTEELLLNEKVNVYKASLGRDLTEQAARQSSGMESEGPGSDPPSASMLHRVNLGVWLNLSELQVPLMSNETVRLVLG